MSSILVYGTTEKNRASHVRKMLENLAMEESENNPDLHIVNPEEGKQSIGIAQARESTKFLQERPFSHKHKVVIVNKAELLTVQAQNALLKTLEEPPSYATIILNVKTENSLLATVVSRCRRVRVDESGGDKEAVIDEIDLAEASAILKMSIGERLDWAAEYSKEERGVVIQTMEEWVSELRENLNLTNGKNIEIILNVKKDLEKTNVSLKLALEFLMLKIR